MSVVSRTEAYGSSILVFNYSYSEKASQKVVSIVSTIPYNIYKE